MQDLRNDILKPHQKHQNLLAKDYFLEKRRRLLLHPTLDPTVNSSAKANQIVLYSNVDTFSYQWLLAIPNAGLGQVMTPREFRAAVSLRLLIPFSQAETPCTALGCNGTADPFGYHVLSCGGGDNQRKCRHDTVRDALYDLSRIAGFHPIKDAPVYIWQPCFVQPIC